MPKQLGQLLGDPNPARARAALNAMFTMSKIAIAEIKAAADSAGEKNVS